MKFKSIYLFLSFAFLFIEGPILAEGAERYVVSLRRQNIKKPEISSETPMIISLGVRDVTRVKFINALSQARSHGEPLPVYTNKVEGIFSKPDWVANVTFYVKHENSEKKILVPPNSVFHLHATEPLSNEVIGIRGLWGIDPIFIRDKPLGKYELFAVIDSVNKRFFSKDDSFNEYILVSPGQSKTPAYDESLKGMFFYWREDFEKSIYHYEKAMELDDKIGVGLPLLNSYEKLRRYNEAIALADKLLSRHKDDRGPGKKIFNVKRKKILELIQSQKNGVSHGGGENSAIPSKGQNADGKMYTNKANRLELIEDSQKKKFNDNEFSFKNSNNKMFGLLLGLLVIVSIGSASFYKLQK